MSDWLQIDIKNCSTAELVRMHAQLDSGAHEGSQLQIRQELVHRLKQGHQWTNQQIIDFLIQGVPKGSAERNALVRAYAPALGLSESEVKRMMGVR